MRHILTHVKWQKKTTNMIDIFLNPPEAFYIQKMKTFCRQDL